MMLNLCLLEHQMNKFRPSVLALAVIYLSMTLLKMDNQIVDLMKLIESNEQQIRNCSLDIFLVFHKIKRFQQKNNRLNAVFRKFSEAKYNFVGLIDFSGPRCPSRKQS